ncbi:hypothetical protein [Sphingomonas sp. 35-24ZXX]|uniref:hypothetical protein n=1 Tax=Sphingomonas sp. 35-24ZXX TaxID=1545915 RepID=UPI00053BF8B2|nr:hypothetical protein [Sphingomonas sp. 35-24ZXX]
MGGPQGVCGKLYVDFKFAVRINAGNYLIGHQIVNGLGSRSGVVWYWRYRLHTLPAGFFTKQINRLQNREARLRLKAGRVAHILLRKPK